MEQAPGNAGDRDHKARGCLWVSFWNNGHLLSVWQRGRTWEKLRESAAGQSTRRSLCSSGCRSGEGRAKKRLNTPPGPPSAAWVLLGTAELSCSAQRCFLPTWVPAQVRTGRSDQALAEGAGAASAPTAPAATAHGHRDSGEHHHRHRNSGEHHHRHRDSGEHHHTAAPSGNFVGVTNKASSTLVILGSTDRHGVLSMQPLHPSLICHWAPDSELVSN